MDKRPRRAQAISLQGIDLVNGLHFIPPELDPISEIFVGGKDLHHISPHPKGTPVKVKVVALVLDLHQTGQEALPGIGAAFLHINHHPLIDLGRPQAVNAGDGGYDDDVAPLEKGVSGGVPQLVYVIVDQGVFFDIGIGMGNVGFRLIVVIIADEVFHRIPGKKIAEFGIQLSRQGLVVSDDQGRYLDVRYDICHGEGLAGTGDPQEDLMRLGLQDAFRQFSDGLNLVALGLEGANQLKGWHSRWVVLE